jgi:hypothetical protein
MRVNGWVNGEPMRWWILAPEWMQPSDPAQPRRLVWGIPEWDHDGLSWLALPWPEMLGVPDWAWEDV